MDLSLLPALTAFTSLAFAVAATYLLLAGFANIVGILFRHFRPPRSVSCRPGEVVHHALKISGRQWDHYRTAALLFCVSLILLLGFGRHGWWPDFSAGIYGIVGFVLAIVLSFGAVKSFNLIRYRSRLSNLLDAHIDVAQRLTEAQLRGNRVYYAVPVDDGIIDNVVVGSNGIYTVSLVMPPANGVESVQFRRRGLVFQPGAVRHDLRQYGRSIVALTKALSACVGDPVIVQTVIVVPNCRIEEAQEDGPLLVSMESCNSFVGWKDPRAFLMDDDLAKVNDWLSRQFLEQRPSSMQQLVSGLEGQANQPVVA